MIRLLALAALLACSAPPRPPVPDALGELALVAPRVERFAAELERERELRAAETAFLTARTARERARAARAWTVARRNP